MCQSLTHVCLGTWDPRMDQPEAEVPPSDRVCAGAVRRGVLQKLTARGWLFSGSWKKRFCVLTHHALYYYEKEHSSGRDKTCGVLNLEYYDVCEEDPKRPFTFYLDSSVKAFFDNRHQFCAESAEDLEGWTAAIRTSIEESRRSRKRRTHEAVLQEGSRTPDCLVGANKDRVKGPQGRRPPQRKSLMPVSRSDEMDLDGRQRSVSLSGPQRGGPGLELPPVTEGKWLSLSMEEVDLEKGPSEGAQRSSSAADIPQQEGTPRRAGPRPGNLLTQHAALTRELEMRLKVGLVNRTPCKEEDEERTEVPEERTQDEDQVKEVLLQVKTALQDVENMKAEYRRALSELQEAKRGFQQLQEEYREALDKLPH